MNERGWTRWSCSVAILVCHGCGSSESVQQNRRQRLPAPIKTEIRPGCFSTISSPELLESPHIPIGAAATYNSNPPSSGPHYPIWAAYKEFVSPVDRRFYVHNLEHGGVVFLYKCQGACPEIVDSLKKAANAIPTDPACASSGVRARTVITPDPLLTSPVAVTAWGWTYTADCADVASLTKFANENYGHGSEAVCTNGIDVF